MKLLIADDEPNILKVTSNLMRDVGYTVVTAVNGEEAVALAEKEKPNLIILDVNMPRLSGFDACRAIRKIAEIKEVPIILLTALDDDNSRVSGFGGGADEYLTKPFNFENLKSRVEALLRGEKKLEKIF